MMKFTLATLALTLFSLSSAQQVIFGIDESGSMGQEQAFVKDAALTIFNGLTDPSVAVVGYGDDSKGDQAHVQGDFTNNPSTFQTTVDNLRTDGRIEDAYKMVIEIANNHFEDESSLSFISPPEPYCVVVISDEKPNQGSFSAPDVIEALQATRGIFFGILGSAQDDAELIAAETNGVIFPLDLFKYNPDAILKSLISACTVAVEGCCSGLDEYSGHVYVPKDSCTGFHQCVNGRDAGFHWCPDGLLFNTANNVCDWPINVDCTESCGWIDPPEASCCDGVNKGLLAVNGCEGYVSCDGGLVRGYHPCPAGLQFDESFQTCTWPSTFHCEAPDDKCAGEFEVH